MAYTKGLRTVTAGFTRAQLIDAWGEVLADIGLMANSTAWYDSFTTTSSQNAGTEFRVVEEVIDASKTYGKVYHVFAVFPDGETSGTNPNSLFYSICSGWDNVNHQYVGTDGVDYPGPSSYKDPSLMPFTSFTSYYASIFDTSNAADVLFHTFNETNQPSYVLVETADENFIVGYHSFTGSDLREPDLLDTFMTNGLWGVNASRSLVEKTAGYGVTLPRCLTGIDRTTDGDRSNYATIQGYYNGWSTTSGRSISLMQYYPESSGLIPILASQQGALDPAIQAYEYQPRYLGVRNMPFDPTAYIDKTFGANAVMMIGYNFDGNAATFQPAVHDSLVVVAGVEEYYVVGGTSQAGNSQSSMTFSIFALRTV